MKQLIIGQNIPYKGKPYVVFATKEQALTEEFLKRLNFKLTIADVEKLAKKELFVTENFDYLIGEILHTNNENNAVLGALENVFKEDILIESNEKKK